METDVLPEIEEAVTEPDGKAHIVRIKSLMTGGAVVALCGKRYIPSVIAGAERMPHCPKCDELMGFLEMISGEKHGT